MNVIPFRDLLMGYLGSFTPEYCSQLSSTNEYQDTNHSDVYHYCIDMNCAFVDAKGSNYDVDSPDTVVKNPDTDIEMNVEVVTEI